MVDAMDFLGLRGTPSSRPKSEADPLKFLGLDRKDDPGTESDPIASAVAHIRQQKADILRQRQQMAKVADPQQAIAQFEQPLADIYAQEDALRSEQNVRQGTTPGAGGAFTRAVARNLVPATAAMAVAPVTGKIGAIGGAAVAGPPGAFVGGVGGAVTGGVGAFVVGRKAQDAAIEAALGSEAQKHFNLQEQIDRERHPYATGAGEIATALPTMRPDPRGLRAIASSIASGRVQPGAGVAAANMAGQGGIGVGMEGYRQYQEGEFDPVRLAMEGAAGAVLAEPNRLGRRLGIKSIYNDVVKGRMTPEEGRAALDAQARAEAAERLRAEQEAYAAQSDPAVQQRAMEEAYERHYGPFEPHLTPQQQRLKAAEAAGAHARGMPSYMSPVSAARPPEPPKVGMPLAPGQMAAYNPNAYYQHPHPLAGQPTYTPPQQQYYQPPQQPRPPVAPPPVTVSQQHPYANPYYQTMPQAPVHPTAQMMQADPGAYYPPPTREVQPGTPADTLPPAQRATTYVPHEPPVTSPIEPMVAGADQPPQGRYYADQPVDGGEPAPRETEPPVQQAETEEAPALPAEPTQATLDEPSTVTAESGVRPAQPQQTTDAPPVDPARPIDDSPIARIEGKLPPDVRYVQATDAEALGLHGSTYPTFVTKDGVKIAVQRNQIYLDGRGRVMVGPSDGPSTNNLTLTAIHTPPSARGKGAASKALDALLAATDEAGITTRLEPAAIKSMISRGEKAMTTAQLVKWYKRKGYTQEYEGSDSILIRHPKARPTNDPPVTKPLSEPPASDVAQQKQPWEMTKGEMRKALGAKTWNQKSPQPDFQDMHRQVVKQALSEGQPVPPEVLKDYPDLAKPATIEADAARPATPDSPPSPRGATQEKADAARTADGSGSAPADHVSEFAASMSPMQAGRIKGILGRKIRGASGVVTLAKLIESEVGAGATVRTEPVSKKLTPARRRAIEDEIRQLRREATDNRSRREELSEQIASMVRTLDSGHEAFQHRVLASPDGTLRDADSITKHGLDYAEYLTKRGVGASTATDAPTRPTPRNAGFINVEILSDVLKAGKWAAEHTVQAAQWVAHQGFKTITDAARGLIRTFGDGIRKFVRSIWAAANDIASHAKREGAVGVVGRESRTATQERARAAIPGLVKAAGEKAATDAKGVGEIAGSLTRLWSRPLDEIKGAGEVGRSLNEKAVKVTQVAKEYLSQWNDDLVAFKKAVSGNLLRSESRANRPAVHELHELVDHGDGIQSTKFDIAADAGSGKVYDSLSPAAKKIVDDYRALSLKIGQAAEQAGLTIEVNGEKIPFKAGRGGMVWRTLTDEALGILAHPDSKEFRELATKLAKANGIEHEIALGRLRRMSDRVKSRTVATETAREFDVFPTHMTINGHLTMLRPSSPADAAESMAQKMAQRLGFVSQFTDDAAEPQRWVDGISDVKPELAGQTKDLMAALAGIPVTLPDAVPGSAAAEALRSGRFVEQLLRVGLLTKSFIPNLPESVAKVPAMVGARRWLATWKDVATSPRDVLHETARIYARSQDVSNWFVEPGKRRESIARIARQLGLAVPRAVNEFNEFFAAASGLRFAGDLKAGRVAHADKARLELMRFTKPEIESLLAGKADDRLYNEVARRVTEWTQGSTSRASQRSRASNSRRYNALVAFDAYAQMTANRLGRVLEKVYRNPKDPGSWTVAAEFLGGHATSGALATLVGAYVYGGLFGLEERANEAADDPAAFAMESFKYATFGGPAEALLRGVNDSRGSKGLGEIAVQTVRPVSVLGDALNMYHGSGRYRDQTALEQAQTFLTSNVTLFPNLVNWAAGMGFIKGDPELQTSLKAYYRWKKDAGLAGSFEAPDVRSNPEAFYIHMRRVARGIQDKDAATIQRELRAAIGTGNQGTKTVKQSLLGKRVLSDLKPEQSRALRDRIGDDAYNKLAQYDALLTAWAKHLR